MRRLRRMFVMKKIAAMFLAVLLTAMCAFAGAEAATDAVPEINWSDYEAKVQEAGWEGQFVAFNEVAVQMYVPSVLAAVELTDEDRASGYIAYFQTAENTGRVGVQYVDANGLTSEEYKALLETTEGITEVGSGIINGLEVITYSMPESDAAVVAMTTEAGYVLEIAFAPVSDEGFAAVAQIMIASIQAQEIAEDAADGEQAEA